MSNGRYQTTKTNRFYPGRISEERAKQVDTRAISADEITVDDIVYAASRGTTRSIYLMLGVVEDKWGKKAAIEVAQEFTYRFAKKGYADFLKSLGRTEGTPEIMCMWQDRAHALMGPAAATAFSTYDEEKCIVTRTECPFHTGRPEGMESYCKYMGEYFMKAYTEVDPAFIGTEQPFCLSRGDDHCERVFKYKRA